MASGRTSSRGTHHSSPVIFWKLTSRRMPALLITMSMRPKSAIAEQRARQGRAGRGGGAEEDGDERREGRRPQASRDPRRVRGTRTLGDDASAVLHRVIVRRCDAARALDLVDDAVRGRAVAALAGLGAADVVHEHLGPAGAEEERVGAPESVPCTRDHRHASVEAERPSRDRGEGARHVRAMWARPGKRRR